MTKVITRYFDDVSTAHAVRSELYLGQGLPKRIISLYTGDAGAAALESAHGVETKTAAEYKKRLAKGGAVLLVRAGFKPLGVAQITRDVMAEMGAADLKGLVEEVTVGDEGSHAPSVLRGHPLILAGARDGDSNTFHMANWPIPLISRRKPLTGSIFPEHARMANFPLPLISRRKPGNASIFPRHARMANFPLPLISRRKPKDRFAFPRHARMANLFLPLLSKRKPSDRMAIHRHGRMAKWPFPLLLSDKVEPTALIPGGPRMANFPINLLSDRKPKDNFAFERHARMANFPIPLISKRKPFTGSIVPKHGRMANMILPLVLRRSEDPNNSDPNRFTMSSLFGWPTLIRR
ncbi:PucR family transcriptional regulator [Primorskyibacter sp. S187A]|uniref:PucR family transcriptional regulator n=1 Tax=Primorskyibacter sp. S187A TaxID=3415130 RepID=UPI003C7EA03A